MLRLPRIGHRPEHPSTSIHSKDSLDHLHNVVNRAQADWQSMAEQDSHKVASEIFSRPPESNSLV